MPKLSRGSLDLHFEVSATGKPTLLLHGIGGGYGPTFEANGWVEDLTAVGRSAIGLDARGRGESSVVTEATQIPPRCQVYDTLALLDHLGLDRVDLIGFSMGAGVGLRLLADHGERFDRAVLISCNGLGLAAGGFAPHSEQDSRDHLAQLHHLLRATVGAAGPDSVAYLDAQFAVWAGADLDPVPTGALGTPTMLITGADDEHPAGFSALDTATLLAEQLDDAGHLLIPDVDHLGSMAHSHVRNASLDHLETVPDSFDADRWR